MVQTGLLMAATSFAAAGPAAAQSNTLQSIGLTVGNFQFDALSAGPGSGELVICLPGFPEFKESWIPIILQLGAAGYHAVAVDQRGYSPNARPTDVSDYSPANLVSDVLGFAQALGASRFHLVGHDRGGSVAWVLARNYPSALKSLSILSTPHQDAFTYALATDASQQAMSSYIQIFTQPAPAGENFLLANGAANMIASFNGVVPNYMTYVQKMQEPGVLTAALNYYRADNLNVTLGSISVPTTYIWGSADAYLGKVAAAATAPFCTGPYTFVQLAGRTHWLMDEDPSAIATLLLQQFRSTVT
ncbi:alpha/beta hydrolase [Paraburkholderia edwinii]|jgi:pimeloyl-ACP methyl ester carboxylesterase|uniref:Alpha/beta hydrolase n=1 Tax=Paraburkholderia edwinii TaxID=2861782 RepID=A0ABX8URE1_9BURK|nr:alpha/beta hydrolase [Paraburkholderia edwinii]QYD71567.1 alpha/beta hydrolase [Paraburkholderia edwinii]